MKLRWIVILVGDNLVISLQITPHYFISLSLEDYSIWMIHGSFNLLIL